MAKIKQSSKTQVSKTGRTVKTTNTKTATSKYAGKAGKRQHEIDKLKLQMGSKGLKAAKATTDIVTATGQQAAAIYGVDASQKILSSADRGVNSWNSVISGTPEAAEGTGTGSQGNSQGQDKTTGSIPSMP